MTAGKKRVEKDPRIKERKKPEIMKARKTNIRKQKRRLKDEKDKTDEGDGGKTEEEQRDCLADIHKAEKASLFPPPLNP